MCAGWLRRLLAGQWGSTACDGREVRRHDGNEEARFGRWEVTSESAEQSLVEEAKLRSSAGVWMGAAMAKMYGWYAMFCWATARGNVWR